MFTSLWPSIDGDVIDRTPNQLRKERLEPFGVPVVNRERERSTHHSLFRRQLAVKESARVVAEFSAAKYGGKVGPNTMSMLRDLAQGALGINVPAEASYSEGSNP